MKKEGVGESSRRGGGSAGREPGAEDHVCIKAVQQLRIYHAAVVSTIPAKGEAR
jgi:hypothetical protein